MRADSMRMSPPPERMASSFWPLTAVTDRGTSLMFSDFFWAVTITSPRVVASSAAVAVWGAASARANAERDTLATSMARIDAGDFIC